MRIWKAECIVVVVAFLTVVYSAGFVWRVRSDDVGDFLQKLEETVTAIADSASGIYDETCDLVESCSSQNCSRRECYPLKEESDECVVIKDYKVCAKNDSESECNLGKVDRSRSLVRLPGPTTVNLSNSNVGDEPTYFQNTVCSQRQLDTVYKAFRNISFRNEQFFYNFYFGSADGVFRVFPARDPLVVNSCNVFDPRVRPWFLGATSVAKHVVILVDTGYTMTTDTLTIPPMTSLDRAIVLTTTLAQTLTLGDQLTVIAVNETGAYSQRTLLADSANTSIEADLANLLSGEAFSGTLSNANQSPKIFDGFDEANSTLSTTIRALKVVLLFTDSRGSSLPGDQIDSKLTALEQEGVKVFIHDLATASSTTWDGVGCSWKSSSASSSTIAYVMAAGANPLLFLNSYFSFLTRARIEANGKNTVFWSKSYKDAGGLGDVITVSIPAMSDDGSTLVGVAGLDVQVSGLDSTLRDGVAETLASTAYYNRTVISRISSFSDPFSCSTSYGKSCDNSALIVPFCTGTIDTTDSDLDTLRSLLCCNSMGCYSGHHKDSRLGLIYGLAIGIPCGLIAILAAVLVIRVLCPTQPPHGPEVPLQPRAKHDRSDHSLRTFMYWTLEVATNQFARENWIGGGSFGDVYKGRLDDNSLIAVKKLRRPADCASDFENELILEVTDHPNLVRLLGVCFRTEDRYLVYDFVEGGDLHSWIWPEPSDPDGPQGNQRFLTWDNRLKIARGIARGLQYLHKGSRSRGEVYHLDIKPQNVLLDLDCNPQISDFGVSKIYRPEHTVRLTHVGGTIGYAAPEINPGVKARPTSKMDVFSYGMVLLQLMSDREVNDPNKPRFLLQWARHREEDNTIGDMIDKALLQSVVPESKKNLRLNCEKLISIALDCTKEAPRNRPEMATILAKLEQFRDVRNRELPDPLSDDADEFFDIQSD